jgi:hypothetical protein
MEILLFKTPNLFFSCFPRIPIGYHEKKLNFFLCQCFMSGNTLGARCSWNKHPLEVEELRGASWGNSLLQRHITLHIKTLIKQGFPPNSQEEITYLTGQFHVFYTFFPPTLLHSGSPMSATPCPSTRGQRLQTHVILTIPGPYHVVIPDLTRLSKTVPQLSIPCALDIIQLSRWVVMLQPSGSGHYQNMGLTLGSCLSWVAKFGNASALGFTLHLRRSATFSSVITLC